MEWYFILNRHLLLCGLVNNFKQLKWCLLEFCQRSKKNAHNKLQLFFPGLRFSLTAETMSSTSPTLTTSTTLNCSRPSETSALSECFPSVSRNLSESALLWSETMARLSDFYRTPKLRMAAGFRFLWPDFPLVSQSSGRPSPRWPTDPLGRERASWGR